jgi:adenosylcobalamin-dependent ribonucleoside-triphosphate reductase
MKLLSEEFLAKYRKQTPKNAGVLFYPIYLRTYSRWLEDKQRRERWDETVERVVEYSLSLYQGPNKDHVGEAEHLYDSIFNLKILPAGRTLWIGGTKAAEKCPEVNFNCSFRIIDGLEAFTDLFHLLLCGCGVGFRVLEGDVATLPSFKQTELIIDEYVSHPYGHREEDTHTVDLCPGIYIQVGDSRAGWVKALEDFLHYSRSGGSIHMNFSNVRPAGERIKGFGGHAPGPEGLMEMFRNVNSIINASGGRLSPVDCMDICNYIGKNVIVGGTRRSSQIALGSPEDEDFMEAKKDLWSTKQNLQRAMSNNSVVFESKPSFEKIQEVFKGIRNNGEPGFFNLEAARKRRPDMEGINPCAEILMDSRGFCNLATVNWKAYAEKGVFNIYGALEALRLAVRLTMRMTNVTVSLPKWDYVQKRDRLLGDSLTGLMDALDLVGLEFDDPQAIQIFKTMKAEAREEANAYAFEMRVPAPLLVTTIKPEGTLSQLPTVSSGLHRSYAPYFIRRVRYSAMDPACQALQKLGVPNEPDQGKAERIVFSFPIKTDAKISANEEPARRQFERYLTMMEHYVDHNASCTLTIGEGEWEEMEKLVFDNFDKVVACAFLPKYTDAFPQMPYEEITKEQYEKLAAEFPNLDSLPDLVNQIETGEFESELEEECKGGFCPVR